MRKTKKLKADGKELNLRLTVAGQLALQDKFDEDTMQTVLTASSDPRRMTALLDEALNWKGNENPVTDGAELYDLLVDEGYAGVQDFGALAMDIAVCSGVIDKKMAQKMNEYLTRTVEGALEGLSAENPTKS